VFQILPLFNLFLGVAGIGFQVLVLYPWHEELSAEFRDLEDAIVDLNARLGARMPPHTRETDKYIKEDSLNAGPKLSSFLPYLFPKKE
jgi:hypothetical protein